MSCYSAFFFFVFGVLITNLPAARVAAAPVATKAVVFPDVVAALDSAPRLWISASDEIDGMNVALSSIREAAVARNEVLMGGDVTLLACSAPTSSSVQSIEDLERLVAFEVDELARKFATQ